MRGGYLLTNARRSRLLEVQGGAGGARRHGLDQGSGATSLEDVIDLGGAEASASSS